MPISSQKIVGDRHGGGSPLLRRAMKGVALGFVGLGAGRLLAILFQILISRWHGHAFLGAFFTGMTMCFLLETIASLGLQKGAMRFVSMFRERGDADAVRIIARCAILAPIVSGLIVATAGWLLAPLLAGRLFSDPEMTPVLQRFALATPFLSLLRIAADMSRGFGSVKYAVAIEELGQPLFQLSLFLVMQGLGRPAVAAADAFVLSSALCSGLMLIFLNKQVRRFSAAALSPPQRSDRPTGENVALDLLRYSLPLIPFGFLFVMGNLMDIGMLNYFRTASDVGEYGAAARWPMLAGMAAGPLLLMFGPLYAARFGVDDFDSLRLLYRTMARWTLFLMLPVIVFISAARVPLILLFGPGFGSQTPITLVVLALGVLVSCFSGGSAILLIVTSHQKAEMGCLAAGLVFNFTFNLLLIPVLGILGAAIATSLGNALTSAARLLMVHKHLHFYPFGPGFLPPLLAAFFTLAAAMAWTASTAAGVNSTLFASGLAAALTLIVTLGTFIAGDDRALWTETISKMKSLSPFQQEVNP